MKPFQAASRKCRESWIFNRKVCLKDWSIQSGPLSNHIWFPFGVYKNCLKKFSFNKKIIWSFKTRIVKFLSSGIGSRAEEFLLVSMKKINSCKAPVLLFFSTMHQYAPKCGYICLVVLNEGTTIVITLRYHKKCSTLCTMHFLVTRAP